MKNYKSLLENLKITDAPVRRYSLSEMISESYKAVFQCEKGTNLYRLAEAHLQDVRDNPKDTDHLSAQLGAIKNLIALKESGELKDDELVPKEAHDEVDPKEDRAQGLKESKDDEDVEEKDDENLLDEAEEPELTDEELEELTKHLETIRKERKAAASTPAPQNEACDEKTDECGTSAPMKETTKARKLKRANEEAPIHTIPRTLTATILCDPAEDLDNLSNIIKSNIEEYTGYDVSDCRISGSTTNESKEAVKESKSYESMDLSEFGKKSSSKAFMKTFKKMHDKLKEGTALTRQESISLYKAANSAMTHLSVELEHNPEFLDTFKESVTLLSADVDKLLGSMKEGKAPSKKTMKSLAKFTESLLREAEENEEETPIEDEENEFISDEEGDIHSEEEEDFDQEYADARVELQKELADEHADTEDPGVQEKLAQDAEEVVNLPGITDEQVAEITGEESESPEEETPAEETAEDETPEEDEEDITDDELEELKRHLTEMRKAKNSISENAKIGDTIIVNRDEEYYKDHGYKANEKGYIVKSVENYGVFIDGYKYLIPHSDYKIVASK